MVPLEVGDPSSHIFPPSPLEVKQQCFKNTISNFTKNIDCKVNVEGLNKKPIEALDFQSNKSYKDIINSHPEHRKTPYNPSFNQKKHITPGVGAYTPQYEAILPSPIKISLKEKKNDKYNIDAKKSNIKKKRICLKKVAKSKSSFASSQYADDPYDYYDYEYEYEYEDAEQKEKQFDAYSTADVISLYQRNMRDFDENSIKYPKFEAYNNADDSMTMKHQAYKESLKGESAGFRHDACRDFFDTNSLTKNIQPADPVPPPPPPVPILARQKNREIGLLDRLKFFNETAEDGCCIAGRKADDGTYKHFNMHNAQVADLALSLTRNYPDAASQLDKLKPRTPSLTSIRHQQPRFESPPKNKRVEFLQKITREQRSTMKLLTKNQSNEDQSQKEKCVSVLSQSKSKRSVKTPAKSKSRPKSAFDLQSSRPKSLFPGMPEPFPGTKYPCDPIESYKKTIPAPKRIKISDNSSRDFMWQPP